MTRTAGLQTFIDSLCCAFQQASPDAPVERMARSLFSLLDTPARRGMPIQAQLPVCQQLPKALEYARSSGPTLAKLADAFAAISDDLAWIRRAATAPNASANWHDGHANAIIIGPNGIEERNDVWIGASLMAPNVRYPDHNHEPEEIYLLMTPGKFQHGQSDWIDPGIGGTLHNVPNIQHAMASQGSPFLAFWCLLVWS